MHLSLTLCNNIIYGCHMNITVIYFPTLGKHSRLMTVLFVLHLSEIMSEIILTFYDELYVSANKKHCVFLQCMNVCVFIWCFVCFAIQIVLNKMFTIVFKSLILIQIIAYLFKKNVFIV